MKNPSRTYAYAVKRRVKDVQRLDQLGHSVHRNSRREDGHDRKRDRVQSPRLFVKAQAEILGNRSSPRPVIERHHENSDKDHCRNGPNPIEVAGRNSIFGARSAHADYFLSSQVCRQKCQPADPGRNGTSGEEKIGACLRSSLQSYTNSQYKQEIKKQNEPVNACHRAETMPFSSGWGRSPRELVFCLCM